jgi:hypothetical protein
VRHRLGRFEPKPGSSVYDSFHLHPKLAPLVTRALEDMLHVPLSPHAAHEVKPATPPVPGGGPGSLYTASRFKEMSLKPGPDLLTVIRPGHDDRVWVTEVKDELEELSRRYEIRLLACEYEPGPEGFIAIAGTSPSISAEVREHDPVMAGFVALRDGERPVRVMSRIFRVVCNNGSLLSAHEEEIDAKGYTVEERVQRCFDRDRFLRAVETLRLAASKELGQPGEMLDEMWHMMRQGPEVVGVITSAYQEMMEAARDAESKMRSETMQDLLMIHRAQIEAIFQEAGDPTVYGLMNAVTATARDLPSFRDRIDLEELGGSLARLDPGPRTRTPDPEHATALA